MSFLHTFAEHHDPAGRFIQHHDPVGQGVYGWLGPKTPPPVPGVPNQNDAANAAQAQTDAFRMRRGMLANIYGGASSQQPVTGKTQLGG